jgi:N6-L-threonylcarbamoyladenine synthase
MKTSLLYFLRDKIKENSNFIDEERHHVAASFQEAIVTYLLKSAKKKIQELNIKTFTIAGGVSANSVLRRQVKDLELELGVKVHIPNFEYCTDNAAMIGVVGYFMHLDQQETLTMDACPRTKWKMG